MPNSSGAATDQVGALRSQRAAADQHLEELTTEAHNLEEIARNQSHPNNLVAVKKNGAPILASPAEGAKLLFTAKAQDEFEILDMNESWVHVRISGLSRGWIRRSNLEMPGATSTPETNSDSPFHVTNEQTATFPEIGNPCAERRSPSLQCKAQPKTAFWVGVPSGTRLRRCSKSNLSNLHRQPPARRES
jgi:hypothetical protein